MDSVIQMRDDCISMEGQMTDVMIKNVKCGPCHDINIGSMGRNIEEKDVSRIAIQNCTIDNTDNGVRIKTWPSSPASLTISDLNFLDLTMINASNPVIIDQQYCPYNLCSLDVPSLAI
ncbi:polygalacturonase-like [Salvia splendens]|uniref:polygalacturonase-like n=1 Tax=Salvia splendens TaxID=180675 RepID=UPI001C275CE9|nr:polygalacturonase-like [Salvia splendens]